MPVAWIAQQFAELMTEKNAATGIQRLTAWFGAAENRRKLLANTAWLAADKLLRLLLSALAGAWVARYLGPSQYGELAYALTLCAFFQTLAMLGLDGLVIRDIAHDPTKAGVVLGTALRLRMMAALFAWFSACGVVALLRPGDTYALLLIALIAAGIVFQTSDVIDLWFQSQVQSRRTVMAKTSAYVFASLIKIALVLARAPLWCFAVVQILDSSIAALLLSVIYRRFRCQGSWSWDRSRAISLMQEGWPFLLAGLSVTAYMRIDQIMLRQLSGDKELGIYSAAIPFSQAWNFVPIVVCASLLPYLSKLHREDSSKYLDMLQKLFNSLALCSFAIVAVMVAVAHPLVRMLLGPQYAASSTVLMIHVATNVFIFLGVAQGSWILNERRSHISLTKSIVGACANVFANLLLIPRLGAVGAAVSAVFAQLVSSVLCNIVLAPPILRMQIAALLPFAGWGKRT